MMQLYRYPQSDFDRPDVLLNTLGSFWSSTYLGNSFVEDICKLVGQQANQSNIGFLELVNSISRNNVPVFNLELWYPLQIKESEINTDSGLITTYTTGTTNKYETPAQLFYGQIPTVSNYACKKPVGLVGCNVVFNSAIKPTVEFIFSTDFWFKGNQIVFRENPFDNSSIAKRDILNAEGRIVDREITLWLYRSQWDKEYIYKQFGYALQLKLNSSENYKQFVNSVLASFNEGTSIRTQQESIAAAFGVPLVKNKEETVETVVTDSNGLKIITDKYVYAYPNSANATVSTGQKVYAGQSLTDTFEIIELNRGFNSTMNISSLALGPELLASGYYGGLVFENKNVPVVVETDDTGYTRVSWEISGFPGDVEKFWDDVHANGVAKNETLAMLLDVRENPIGQPTAASLPSEINPLAFLIDNLLRANTYVVKVKPGSKLQNRLEFVPVNQLRKIIPPQTAMLLLVELQFADEPVIMLESGTELKPGYEEQVTSFQCLTGGDDLDPTVYANELVKTKQITGRCI
jgi:hypothetical protein